MCCCVCVRGGGHCESKCLVTSIDTLGEAREASHEEGKLNRHWGN